MKRPRMMISYRVAVAIKIQPIVANGDDIMIVFFLPIYCSRKPAIRLPQNAPLGGIEPARKSIAFIWNNCNNRVYRFDFIYYLPMMQCFCLATIPDELHVSMGWLETNSHGPVQCKKMTLTCIVKVSPRVQILKKEKKKNGIIWVYVCYIIS